MSYEQQLAEARTKVATARTCQAEIGTLENPDVCGRPATFMQPGEGWEWVDEWPVCGRCAGDDAYPIEELGQ